MVIRNGCVVNDAFTLQQADLQINGERIEKIGDIGGEDSLCYDAAGGYVIPGFIDMHIHGCAGKDCCDDDDSAITDMAAYLAKNGVTSFACASMTLPRQQLEKVFTRVAKNVENGTGGAWLHGVNMEGPYFSMEKRGAQNPAYIRNPDVSEFLQLNQVCKGHIKVVDIAPELDGSMEFIKKAKQHCRVSIAHTTADYETARQAIDAGASHCTHLYNAMPPFTHRAPGVIGAVYESDSVRAELICDGIHIHPAVVRSTFKTLGQERVVLISDGMSATGMPEGEYELGGLQVFVKDCSARLANGTLAGSASNLYVCFKKAIEFGIDFTTALKAATINPAKALGADKQTGSLKEGKLADIVILNKDFSIQKVFVRGREII